MLRTVNSIKSNHNENSTRLTLLTRISAAYGAKKKKKKKKKASQASPWISTAFLPWKIINTVVKTIAHNQYIKNLTWLWGFRLIFLYIIWVGFLYTSASSGRQWSREKIAISSLKPLIHVRILIYRLWAILVCRPQISSIFVFPWFYKPYFRSLLCASDTTATWS